MALIPLLGGAIFNDENVLLLTIMLSASFVLAGIGVIFLLAAVLYGQVMKNLYKRAIIQRKKEKLIYYSYYLGFKFVNCYRNILGI